MIKFVKSFAKFGLNIILLSILNFIAIKIMLINADVLDGLKGYGIILYKVKPFQYAVGIFLIIISKVIFDVEFHKAQKNLGRDL
jgi:hypothetical protein